MRPADEIKKGLECCSNVNFVCNEECPYYKSLSEGEDCCLKKNADALALIQQLQTENAEKDQRIRQLEAERDVLDYTLAGVMHSVDKWLDVEPYKMDGPTGNDAVTRSVLAREIALKAIEQAQTERDAAVADLEHVKDCDSCKYDDACFTGKKDCFGCHEKRCPCLTCQYEWRGVQKEE